MFKIWFNYLLLIHVICDFYLQTDKIAKDKNNELGALVKHSIIYLLGFGVCVMPVISIDMLLLAIAAGVIHAMIDYVKVRYMKRKKVSGSTKIFVIDQLLHVVCIVYMSFWIEYYNFNYSIAAPVKAFLITTELDINNVISWCLAISLLIRPAGIFISYILHKYKPVSINEKYKIEADYKSGRFIGYIERISLILFLYLDAYAALGLVLTAKSIYRQEKGISNKQFGDYYLIGTLLSTCLVLIVKILVWGM